MLLPLPDPLPLPEPDPEPDPEPNPDPELEPELLPLLVPELAPFPPSLEPTLLEPELDPEVVATDAPVPLLEVKFPIPFPASLSLADILDKSEKIGLSLLVIPYAATAAAIHKTIIMEMIIFALSNVFPP